MNKALNEVEASWFHPAFGNEVVEGWISADRWHVHFRSETFEEEIPMDRISLELDEAEDRIYLRDSARSELVLYTLDSDILESHFLPESEVILTRLRTLLSKREMNHRLRLLGYFVASCFLIYFIGSIAMSLAVRSLANRVSPEWEQSIGNKAMAELTKEGLISTNTNAVAQLAEICDPLIKALPPGNGPFTFHIMEEELPNAFAMPGGHVVVTSGMLQMVDNQEELLAVLAHELAHVTEKHFERRLIAAAGPLTVFAVSLHSGGPMGVLGAGSGAMMMSGFSQEYESEADAVGWKYLVKANINPRAMITMFEKLKAVEADLIKDNEKLPEAFSSHPALDKRIARLESKAKRLPRNAEYLPLTNAVPKIDGFITHHKMQLKL